MGYGVGGGGGMWSWGGEDESSRDSPPPLGFARDGASNFLGACVCSWGGVWTGCGVGGVRTKKSEEVVGGWYVRKTLKKGDTHVCARSSLRL